MKKLSLIFLVFMAACLAGCRAEEHKTLVEKSALWESQAVDHYRYNFKMGCMCPWTELMPLTVEIKAGEIISMTASNGDDISPYQDTFRQHGTIESLFDTLDVAISKGVYGLEVVYDETYGFPATVVINPSKRVYDDETGYYITNFEVLP